MKRENVEMKSEMEVKLPFCETKEYHVTIEHFEKKLVYGIVKRCFDFCVALLSLVVLFVPMFLIAICIKCSSHGPIFYSQERLGLNGKTFKVLKFRSMVHDAEKNGIQWCEANDPRVTKVGKFLRNHHLDELPQILNILVGDMSLVGPRPERKYFYDVFETYIHGFHERLRVKPGLTGLAQISGDGHTPPEEKIIYDIDYINKRSMFFDIKILCKTFVIVLAGRYSSS